MIERPDYCELTSVQYWWWVQSMEKSVTKSMEIVREYCRLGHKLRQTNGIPAAYPLYEFRVNEADFGYLNNELRQIIAEEINVDYVEPIIDSSWSTFATVATLQEAGYRVALDITQDHFLSRIYEHRQNERRASQERKDKGLAYIKKKKEVPRCACTLFPRLSKMLPQT